MLAEIITIGDEILIGQIIDTNSAWIAKELNRIGVRVAQITSVSDNKKHILDSLSNAESKSDLIIITGGLGPTKDDLTKHTLCEYFDAKLIRNEQVWSMVSEFFRKRDKPLTKLNEDQALVPNNCKVILNHQGTAPGMWFERNNKIFISLPGVPYEMKSMMIDFILPAIEKEFKLPVISHFTIFTQGIGESFLAEKIESWEEKVKRNGFGLAYLPSPGLVKLRMSAFGMDPIQAETRFQILFDDLKIIIGNNIFGFTNSTDEITIQQVISKLLIDNEKSISIAESCTGGYLSHLMTSIPGSSNYFRGSIIAYHNSHKIQLLNVKPETFTEVGAVSEECVSQMAKNCMLTFGSDYAIATSGIAGPSGGSSEKPVGTVWVAVASNRKIKSCKFQFGTDRIRNIQMASSSALNLLRELIFEDN